MAEVIGSSAFDVRLLFATRILRMGAYGALAVVRALYLAELGFSEKKIGLLLTLTLVGDTAISLWLTVVADRVGRRKVLIVGAVLMAAAGAMFAISTSWVVLLVAATIGVISPSGKEVGPFLSIEQAALSHVSEAERRTHLFAWYNLLGSIAAAVGALAGGWLVDVLHHHGAGPLTSYKIVLIGYAATGMILAGMFLVVSRAVEAGSAVPEASTEGGAASGPVRDAGEQRPTSNAQRPTSKDSSWLGLHESRGVVMRLAGLFALDA